MQKETAEILQALCWVVERYMKKEHEGTDREGYAHMCEATGEAVCDVLEKYGLAKDDGYCIVPTKKFHKLSEMDLE